LSLELKCTLKDASVTGYFGKLGYLYIAKLFIACVQNKSYFVSLNLLQGNVKFDGIVQLGPTTL
jgi:hypothetical protein